MKMVSSRQPLAIYEHILRIKNSMRDFGIREAICPSQCEHLILRIAQQCDRVSDIICTLFMHNRFSQHQELVTALLDRFICNMEAVEDLLYLCAKVDWKVAALSVFLPASCNSSHSKFALLARDLHWTSRELHFLLRPLLAFQIGPLFRGRSDVLNDYWDVLRKLESVPSKGAVFQRLYEFLNFPSNEAYYWERYDFLLRKRLQADASPSTPGSVPDWCRILEKLEFSYVGVAGSGSGKSILKCYWLGMDVAIAVYTGENAKTNLETEAGILASVQHPNVVTLYRCAYDNEEKVGHLVTELMEQDLSQLIRKRKASRGDGEMPFSLSVSKDIILQIVEAMMHLRKCRVLHRDLKPANCLVRAKKRIGQNGGWETYYVVKLIDFGSAKVRGPDDSTCHTRKQGTTAYMAPELHAMPDECAYKWSADVYSLEMTMYEILSGSYPFEEVYTGGELVRRVCAGERPSFPDCVPGDWRELIKNCWHPDPEKRSGLQHIRMRIIKCTTSLNF